MAFRLRDLVARLRITVDKKTAADAEKEVTSGFDRMAAAAKRVGSAIASAFAVDKIIQVGAALIRTAAEAEAPWNRLANTLANVGVRFGDVERRIRLAANALSDSSTVGDEQFAETLDRLVALSGDFEGSLRNVNLVADVAAKFFNGELAPATDLVGRAMAGNIRQLRQLGITTKDANEGLRELAAISAGAAANELNTLQGRTKQLAEEWDNLREAAGNALLRLTAFVSGAPDANIALNRWRLGLQAIREELERIGQTERDKRAALREDELRGGAGGAFGAGGIPGTTIGIPVLPGISVTAEDAKKAAAEVKKLAAEEKRLADQREEIENRRKVREGNIPTLAGTEGIPTIAGGLSIGGSAERQAAAIESLNELVDEIGDTATPALDRWEEQWLEVGFVAQGVAADITNAFETMFSNIISGQESVGNAMVGFGKGIARSLIGGLKEYFNVERAKEIAAGIGKLAAGTWPPNPAAIASAGKHFLSAAAWAAASGLAGAAAGAIGGSSGGGSFSGGGASAATARPFEPQRTGPQMIIYVDGFDTKNPVHIRRLGEGMRAVGAVDSDIEIRPRSAAR